MQLQAPSAVKGLKTLRVLRLIKLVRLIGTSRVIRRWQTRNPWPYGKLACASLLFQVLYICHLSTPMRGLEPWTRARELLESLQHEHAALAYA